MASDAAAAPEGWGRRLARGVENYYNQARRSLGEGGVAEKAGIQVPGIIAIDGPGASGKSAVGRQVARRLGYRFLDTGAMYRALTWWALQRGVDPKRRADVGRLAASTQMVMQPESLEADQDCRIWVNGQEATAFLYTPEVDAAVSWVSRVPAVRRALVAQQRRLVREPMVVAGRDIGTVVLPDAPLKVYLDASAAERARRRHRQLRQQGVDADLTAVLADLRRRDGIDRRRRHSPLRPAADAVIINTDGLGLEQVVERVLALVRGKGC